MTICLMKLQKPEDLCDAQGIGKMICSTVRADVDGLMARYTMGAGSKVAGHYLSSGDRKMSSEDHMMLCL